MPVVLLSGAALITNCKAPEAQAEFIWFYAIALSIPSIIVMPIYIIILTLILFLIKFVLKQFNLLSDYLDCILIVIFMTLGFIMTGITQYFFIRFFPEWIKNIVNKFKTSKRNTTPRLLIAAIIGIFGFLIVMVVFFFIKIR